MSEVNRRARYRLVPTRLFMGLEVPKEYEYEVARLALVRPVLQQLGVYHFVSGPDRWGIDGSLAREDLGEAVRYSVDFAGSIPDKVEISRSLNILQAALSCMGVERERQPLISFDYIRTKRLHWESSNFAGELSLEMVRRVAMFTESDRQEIVAAMSALSRRMRSKLRGSFVCSTEGGMLQLTTIGPACLKCSPSSDQPFKYKMETEDAKLIVEQFMLLAGLAQAQAIAERY